MTAAEIYTTLQQIPRLETFAVSVKWDSDPSEDGSTSDTASIDDSSYDPGQNFSPRVVMAFLTDLTISGSDKTCLRLVDSLDMPMCRHINLIASTADTDSFNPFMDPIMASLNGADRPPKSLVFQSFQYDILILNTWGKRLDWTRVWPAPGTNHGETMQHDGDAFENDLPTCRFELSVDTILDPELEPSDIRAQPLLTRGDTNVWSGLCLSELKDLGIQHDHDHIWTKVRWLAIFGDALKLRVLITHGTRAALSLLSALKPPSERRILSGPSVRAEESLHPFLQSDSWLTSDD
ncbi:hypothetical protein BV25DRAFT_1842360 [Artomyces pyxidatus]|uniref:Uncharacterized protein n=1 Tax=Artomyces pyxidatus TaxID=48021 RepID=A0ACB8SJ94_9AGAM|nr:hypothetical protein BV25DRAFT_1842360 [Artomyces pyxidatus]